MNVEIIPAVNAIDWRSVEERIKLVESHAEWVHLDVADGSFTPNALWNNPADLKNLKTTLKLEVHLMVKNPEAVIDAWIAAGAKRLIVHVESMNDFETIKQTCEAAGVELVLSITPESSWTILIPFIKRGVNAFQILAVHPGVSGQQFIDEGNVEQPYLESSYDKIKRLREQCPTCSIEVDGGVKLGIAKQCKEAGANRFAAASAIYSQPDIAKAVEDLKKDVSD